MIDWTDAHIDWHRLGPWYEVGYGIETEQPEFVESGLNGVLKRL